MDIKDRIQKFIEHENFTPAQFADEIKVQRSTISHILSGRNNPGYDVIVKILERYKKLNAEWLILGTGNMLKSIVQASIPFDQEHHQHDNSKQETISKSDTNNFHQMESTTNLNFMISDKENEVKDKEIEKIIFFYNDRTFQIFYPQKS